MSDFAIGWRLSRQRFDEAVMDLDAEQLNWRMFPDALSVGEMALHVAGVEIFFMTQLTEPSHSDVANRLKTASTDGVVNDKPFPFSSSEITPEFVASSLNLARGFVDVMIENATLVYREKELVSALGPVITGEGAFARLAFHPAYHHGQAYQIRQAPGFPQRTPG
jgi:hypothetical protein